MARISELVEGFASVEWHSTITQSLRPGAATLLCGRSPRVRSVNPDIQPRRLESVWESQPTLEGAGVHIRRAFGNGVAPKLDPFLLLDDLRNDNPQEFEVGFPWHPHRGIQTVT